MLFVKLFENGWYVAFESARPANNGATSERRKGEVNWSNAAVNHNSVKYTTLITGIQEKYIKSKWYKIATRLLP